jgi:hypothetical protein
MAELDIGQSIEAVTERDVDLLILEELLSKTGFTEWLASRTGMSAGSNFINAWHSVSLESDGESDLLVMFASNGQRCLLMIENKIDAGFTYEQPERYKKRAHKYLERGMADKVLVLLMAPEAYLERSNKFDCYLALEEVMEWYRNQANLLGARAVYKIQLLEIAILKLRRGYQMRKSTSVSEFWPAYYELVRTAFPDLHMKYSPSGRPVKSRTFSFYIKGRHFAAGDYMAHQGREGTINFYAFGRAYDLEHFIEQYASILPEGVEIDKSGKSAVFYMHTPPFNVEEPFEPQKETVRIGLEQLQKLYRWLLQHYIG